MDARAGSLWHKRAGVSNSSDHSSTSRWRTAGGFVWIKLEDLWKSRNASIQQSQLWIRRFCGLSGLALPQLQLPEVSNLADLPCLCQPGPLSLVEECRGSALIGRELHSVARPALLCHKEPARASKAPSRGLWMPELVLYGIRELALAIPRTTPRHRGGELLEDLSGSSWKTSGSRGMLQFNSLSCGSGGSVDCPVSPCLNYNYQK